MQEDAEEHQRQQERHGTGTRDGAGTARTWPLRRAGFVRLSRVYRESNDRGSGEVGNVVQREARAEPRRVSVAECSVAARERFADPSSPRGCERDISSSGSREPERGRCLLSLGVFSLSLLSLGVFSLSLLSLSTVRLGVGVFGCGVGRVGGGVFSCGDRRQRS